LKSALSVLAVGLCAVVALVGVAAGAQSPQSPVSASTPAPAECRIYGRVTTGNISLPGVSIVVPLGAAHQVVTSTDTDGSYSLALAAVRRLPRAFGRGRRSASTSWPLAPLSASLPRTRRSGSLVASLPP